MVGSAGGGSGVGQTTAGNTPEVPEGITPNISGQDSGGYYPSSRSRYYPFIEKLCRSITLSIRTPDHASVVGHPSALEVDLPSIATKQRMDSTQRIQDICKKFYMREMLRARNVTLRLAGSPLIVHSTFPTWK